MQTFLPFADFTECAQVLDPPRLGNQFYREGMTLIRGGWSHHPASRMWQGYEHALGEYLIACHEELVLRGYSYPHHVDEIRRHQYNCENKSMPPWLGDERVHSTHRANLLRKNPDWFGPLGWTEEPMNGYFWPIDGGYYIIEGKRVKNVGHI